ncbi:hypothetical protein [uncultured Treponema sp.]|jgi:hypothetical protein|uniref:hypothetical protein n=1 Tax=uncultured Treponema sp. TaxID=162155 RepID=UPI0028F0E791|nr:hypothetical protein [uncultured Treponema sp.]
MELDFKHASLQEIIDYAPDLRREAYVDATLRMQADDNIVGVFGSAYSEAQSPVIDEALIYGCGLVPVPIVGVDAFIFKHGDYPACDVIKSTMVYLTTQKCPLLYSSKMYVLDGCCPAVETAFRHCTQKLVHIYNDAATLKTVLQQVYGCEYSATRYQESKSAFLTLNRLLQQLEQSALSGNDFGVLAFYSRFIFKLEERIAFLARVCELFSSAATWEHSSHSPEKREPVSIHCPDGIIQKIKPAAGNYFKPVRVKPGSFADIACAGCIYPAAEYVGY